MLPLEVDQSYPAGLRMWEFQERILALEKEFADARRNLKRLLRQLRYAPDSVAPEAVRAQLGLVNSLIRLIKEESAFYAKLGQLYDFSKLLAAFLNLFEYWDSDESEHYQEEMKKIWTREDVRK